MKVVLVDTGGANLSSVSNALKRIGVEPRFTTDWKEISSAERVILPGVGTASDCMSRLLATGLAEKIPSLTQPVLGICLGMQILYESSEEGFSNEKFGTPCLGIIQGKVRKMTPTPLRPIPHMGWNQIRLTAPSILFNGLQAGEYFYFVHSYKVDSTLADLAYADYGERIPAAIQSENFHGVQFHPERSGQAGARVLRNFLEL